MVTALPAPSDPASDVAPVVPFVARAARSDARILVAVDSPVVRRFAAKLLRDRGYAVDLAVDGFDALGMLGRIKPDLLLLDARMPRLDGFQTCALAKRHPGFGALSVVILSECGGLYARVRAHLAGARSCLSTPFTAEELLQAVAGALADG